MSTFLDIHIIQSLPFNNLNRDDLGFNKTETLGGVPRTRVSSQSWKRAVRMAAEKSVGDVSYRSRHAALDVQQYLVQEHSWDEDLALFAGRSAILAAGFKLTEPKKTKAGENAEEDEPYTTKILLWYPQSAIAEIASLCVTHRDALADAHDAAQAKKARKKTADADAELAIEAKDLTLPAEQIKQILVSRSMSINLFGRFLAELPTGNVDGAVSVAHAFTTHGAVNEVDYFTAVDDRSNRGTGHLATAQFSTGTFYRYASINVDDLARNVGSTEEAIDLAGVFVNHFVTAVPSGKQRSTAAYSLPDLVYTVVRTDRPVSLAGAFEGAVTDTGNQGYAAASCVALARYAANSDRFLGTAGRPFHAHAQTIADTTHTDSLGDPLGSLPDLITAATQALTTASGKLVSS